MDIPLYHVDKMHGGPQSVTMILVYSDVSIATSVECSLSLSLLYPLVIAPGKSTAAAGWSVTQRFLLLLLDVCFYQQEPTYVFN
jgi:hypothetical protein